MGWKQLGDLIENTQKRSPFGRILQAPEITECGSCLASPQAPHRLRDSPSAWHVVVSSGQRHAAFPAAAGSLSCINRVPCYIGEILVETVPVLLDSSALFRERKGHFVKRQKKEFTDSTICSESLQCGKCHFKRIPANLWVNVHSKCESRCELQKWEKLKN